MKNLTVFLCLLFLSHINYAQTNQANNVVHEFVIAIESQDLVGVQSLIEQGFNVNHPEVVFLLGRTPLHYAVHVENPELAETLLDAKAEPNVRGSAQRTPLYMAAFSNQADIVESLLAAGARTDIVDYFGWTPAKFIERMIDKNQIKNPEDYTGVINALARPTEGRPTLNLSNDQ